MDDRWIQKRGTDWCESLQSKDGFHSYQAATEMKTYVKHCSRVRQDGAAPFLNAGTNVPTCANARSAVINF